LAVFLAETLFYAASLGVYLRFSRRLVVPCVRQAGPHQKNLLIRYSIAGFFLILFYNNVMVIGGSQLRRLAVYLLLIYFIVLTYRLMVSYIRADGDKRQLSELAFKDRLTALGNRLALRDHATALLEAGEPFFVLFLDLNRFKSINDTHGHAVGDEYLCAFARALKEIEGVVSFRFSGDEFVCFTRREGVLAEIRALRVEPPPGVEFLGVAAGCAACPRDGATLPALLEAADRAMYQDKKNGRSSRRQADMPEK
uniref:GGDEF domain-containing protein n=1 Tax=Allofournierella sp. TaxID=1940256 RepID=UPI003AB37517